VVERLHWRAMVPGSTPQTGPYQPPTFTHHILATSLSEPKGKKFKIKIEKFKRSKK
jgi:hypothetical protein